jgi:hypothetical protein
MAAGLGFKDFTTGEVLTAADVDGYLMQGIWVFASATARDAAVTSPQEGNACYLKDTNQVLTYSGSAWVAVGGGSPLTTKGDLYTFSTVDARLGVGANDTVLTADSSTATGLKWATPAGSSGPAFYVSRITSDQTTTFNVLTKVEFNGETFDTDNCFDSTTNYRFTPTKAGYYQLNFNMLFAGGSGDAGEALFRKNNTTNFSTNYGVRTGGSTSLNSSMIMYLDGSTDYAEVFLVAYTSNGTVKANVVNTSFSGVWIRS